MKRLFAIVLIAALLCGIAPAAFAEGKPSYVALGDSIAAGYGLEGFADVSGSAGNLVFTVPDGSFAKLIAADQGYDVNDLAISGDDTVKLLSRLRTAQYSEPLKQADVITLTIGSNDLLVKAVNLIMAKFLPGESDHAVMAAPGQGALLDGDLNQMLETLQSVNDYLNSDEVKAIMQTSVESFKGNWDTIIDTLRTWNPAAKLIVTNYYNPFKALDFKYGTLNMNTGSLAQIYLDQMNAYITGNSRNGTSYTIVDVTDTTTNVKIDVASIISNVLSGNNDFSKAINLDPHPDAAGHAYFAKQIEAALLATVFADVPANEWYAEPVEYVAAQKLVVGDEAGNFVPTGRMTLAQYMTVLYRFARANAPAVIPERATTGANWMEAAAYLNTAVMGGAYTNLGKEMTRTEMAEITAAILKLVIMATGKAPVTRETHGFTDAVGNEAVLYLESIYGLDGYLQADGTYQFRGENPITRAEVAKVVYNIMTKSFA